MGRVGLPCGPYERPVLPLDYIASKKTRLDSNQHPKTHWRISPCSPAPFRHTCLHKNGVNSIDWAPATPPVNLLDDNESVDNNDENIEDNYDMLVHMSFISCGNDCKINIFQAEKNTIDSFSIIKSIDLKKQVPRDIAFLNFVGYTELTFACGLDDGRCLIYKNYEDDWKNTFTINFPPDATLF